jgi:hypothetical protein
VAATDVLMTAACAVVGGVPSSSTAGWQGALKGHQRLDAWMGLEQLQPAAMQLLHSTGNAGTKGGPLAAAAAAAAAGGAVGGAGLDQASGGVGGLLGGGEPCVNPLQVGHLRCLLQMGHQQTLLRQVDGLMARCLGQASAAAAAAAAVVQNHQQQQCGAGAGALQAVQWSIGQLAALGVAGAWRLGAWGQLRGYLSVLEAAGESPAGVLRPLSAADRWEVCGWVDPAFCMRQCVVQ